MIEVADLADLQEKCIRLLVQIVEKKQKFLLNQTGQDLFIVGNVFKNIGEKDFR
jgi:hypothetical protein